MSVFVKGYLQILQPILLSIGTAFSALNSEILNLDIQPIEFNSWLSSKKKDDKEDKQEVTKKAKEIDTIKAKLETFIDQAAKGK